MGLDISTEEDFFKEVENHQVAQTCEDESSPLPRKDGLLSKITKLVTDNLEGKTPGGQTGRKLPGLKSPAKPQLNSMWIPLDDSELQQSTLLHYGLLPYAEIIRRFTVRSRYMRYHSYALTNSHSHSHCLNDPITMTISRQHFCKP